MKTITTVAEFKTARREWNDVGFVPTMGALHAGHLSLVERARRECQTVVTSIFVNPTQFNEATDLANYPAPRAQDLEMLAAAGVHAVFLPDAKEIYADDYRFIMTEDRLSRILCGPKRPGHFNGVLTVVLKLFNIVQPNRAYFGEKDYQQLRLIQDMAKAMFLDVEVVVCPTVRECDGLAMSSRNLLLNAEQRELAPALFRVINSARSTREAADQLTDLGFRVDYIEEHFGRRFAAAYLGSVRLIDNVAL